MRGDRGFTLLELMIVIAIVAVLASVAVPGFLGARISANETATVANLRTYGTAQQMFHRADHDGDATRNYAVPYTLLYSTLVDGKPLHFINGAFAGASVPGKALAGYYFTDITQGAGGPFDPHSVHALSASPAVHRRSGYSTFIMDHSGVVYMKDLGDNIPVGIWPADPGADGWVPAGG